MSKKIEQFGIENLPEELKFEALLSRKIIGKTISQQTSMKKYYRDLYKKQGKIPESIYYKDGRLFSGKKSNLSKTIEDEFVNVVKNSASDNVNSSNFITKNLRTVVNFHLRLENKYGKIPIYSLYRLVKKHNLKKYIEKPDYNNEKSDRIIECFDDIEVFDKIQVDGCQFKYIEIKDKTGKWRKPLFIEFMDTGSRFMLAIGVYFSESNESSVNAFSKFLKSTAFPAKRIQIRPDNKNSFLNLKRPIRELNRKYSLPDKFCFIKDYAKLNSPKNKAHLESSHRRLHGYEDFAIEMLPKERLIERIPNVKIKKESGKIEIVTISRFDITIEELRSSELIKRYMQEHNEKTRTFSVSGVQKKWMPKQKFESYLANVETFMFNETHIENCLKYGYRKDKASVAPNGRIRYKKKDYQVIEGSFYGGTKRTNVKVSEYENKLYIFEPSNDGVYLGEAMLVGNTIKPKQTQKLANKILKKNKFEQLVIYLERKGMVVKDKELERLMELYKEGLNVDIASQIIAKHKKTYDKYLNNNDYQYLQVDIILSNLFFAHYAEFKKKERVKNEGKE